MKIIWTIAALAGSVTLGNAQQAGTPRRDTPPAPPAKTVRPAPPAPTPITVLLGLEPLLAPEAQSLLPGSWPLPPIDAPMAIAAPWIEMAPLPPLFVDAPMALAAPIIDITPLPPLAPLGPMMALGPVALPSLSLSIDAPTPLPPLGAEPLFWNVPQGQGPSTPRPVRPAREVELDRYLAEVDRAEAARQRAIEAQDRAAQRQAEQQVQQALRNIELQDRAAQRQQELLAQQVIRDLENRERQAQQLVQTAIRQQEMQERQAERQLEQTLRSIQGQGRIATAEAAQVDLLRSLSGSHSISATAPAPWAPQDVADSAYRVARDLLNRGEYGQAVQAFRALPTKYPNSVYAAEASYYQAFALYRIGGTTELREAIAALDAQQAKYPNAPRSKGDATTLATRIRGVLAARGDVPSQEVLKRMTNDPSTCDHEEQAVQAEAMNALSRSDAGNVNDLITRVLARKDECAVPLRRTAVFLVGNRRDAQAISILAGVARNDPSVDVKVEAIGVIGRLPNDEGVTVLEELTKNDDERIQRAAIRALVRHPSAKARPSVRALVERDDVSERVRSEALSAFDAERATAEDVAWLRALYAKVTTPSLKARTLSAIVRVGGPEVDQWLVTVARDDNQPSEIRATAMRRIGESMSIADLARLYDSATQQRFRSEIISVLGKRKEDAATDKLIDIVKNGTDPSLRSAAIRTISNKNDARATQLLLEIINK